MDEIGQKRREKAVMQKLSADSLFANLVQTSLFLTTFEILKAEIVDHTKGFFMVGFDDSGDLYSNEYETCVLSRDTDKYKAGCLWLVEVGGLKYEDVQIAMDVRKYRNFLAHEIPKLLLEPEISFDSDKFIQAYRLIGELGQFWGSISVDTNPDFDGVDVDYSQIKSGSMIMMDYILGVLAEFEVRPTPPSE